MDAATACNCLLGQRFRLAAAAREDIQDREVGAAATTLEEEVDVAIAASIAGELDEIDRALARLDDGTYGRCEICDAAIPDERLWAVPWTRCCVAHEQAAEAPRSLLSGASAALSTRLGSTGASDVPPAPAELELPADDDDEGPTPEVTDADRSAEEVALHVLGPAPSGGGWVDDALTAD